MRLKINGTLSTVECPPDKLTYHPCLIGYFELTVKSVLFRKGEAEMGIIIGVTYERHYRITELAAVCQSAAYQTGTDPLLLVRGNHGQWSEGGYFKAEASFFIHAGLKAMWPTGMPSRNAIRETGRTEWSLSLSTRSASLVRPKARMLISRMV